MTDLGPGAAARRRAADLQFDSTVENSFLRQANSGEATEDLVGIVVRVADGCVSLWSSLWERVIREDLLGALGVAALRIFCSQLAKLGPA